MDYDRILTQLGEFGRWQRRNAALLWLPAMAGGINIMIAAYAVMPPREYRCQNECDGDDLGLCFLATTRKTCFQALTMILKTTMNRILTTANIIKQAFRMMGCVCSTSLLLYHAREEPSLLTSHLR